MSCMVELHEPYFTLNLPCPKIDLGQLDWKRYNPRKSVARWGASLTSLDGQTGGIPDLDSLLEYNRENGTQYQEKDFSVRTKYFEPFSFLDEYFDLGRSHIIRLGSGGFFPYHRDADTKTFRLIYTIKSCYRENLVWIQHDKVLGLEDSKWYYINTKMAHSVFSFSGSEFAVFNVVINSKSEQSLLHLPTIR